MAECPPNTPVLVGVAAVQQKLADHTQALEPIALMEQALRNAAADAGAPELLAQADEIMVPNSLWAYSDPARLLAEKLGATAATTLLADFGILQQSLVDRACERIARGEASVLLIAGGEARYREQCAARAGEAASATVQEGVAPDVLLQPAAEMMSEVESNTGLGMPVGYYAIMDSALRYKQGLTIDEHRDQMAAMYARYSEIAAQNPDAWAEEAVSAEFIREHSAGNRMLAFPYTKLHNSQWTVDQAAGLILCSAEKAQQWGIDRAQWVFPLASTESNFMSLMSSRGDLAASEGFRLAGAKAMELAGVDFNEVRLKELYSCFPYAVRVQQEEFGLTGSGDISVTGAMTFGGGPLNNFVFQATVKMAQLLRESPGETGLVTTVSGLMTKQACGLWSTQAPARPWAFADVTEEVRAITDVREVTAQYEGDGVIAGYTVLFQGMDPWRAVAVIDMPDGRRTVAYSEDAPLMQQMMVQEFCGEACAVAGGQFSQR
ncbi:MAG: acetyl-CoA acetyltransferase [Gammaproteobacteria bacterium]|nr:acetyl-CoA acetyltransferase [Gammaproteobacteria bacterium]